MHVVRSRNNRRNRFGKEKIGNTEIATVVAIIMGTVLFFASFDHFRLAIQSAKQEY